MPCPLNRLTNVHWATRSKLKAHDREIIGNAVLAYQVPKATSKRRIDITIILPKGKRAVDPDAIFKSLCDGLVHAGALKNDSHLWVELGAVRFCRGFNTMTTFITLQDV